MNSGWRNPERNERVGGVWTSRHMYGRAIDVGTDVYAQDTRDRALLMWVLWNSTATNVTGARRWILERAVLGEPLQALLNQVVGNDRPTIDPDDQLGGGPTGQEPDGIWDKFNRATHLHVESNP